MKAAVFHSPKQIKVDTVPDPRLESATDMILRVTSTAICGSDLHIYNGLFPQPKPLVMGHEFMGIVQEAGSQVQTLRPGDRVVVPFPIACGQCYFCQHQLPIHCESSNREHYGPEGGVLREKGGGLFGYTDLYGGYSGGQAEFVRVPYADVGPRKVPDDLTDEQALFLSDILPTGWAAAAWGELKGGESVAVFGCGPVGLMAQRAAWIMGASRVFALDREDYRLQKARQMSDSMAINVEKQKAVEVIREMTGGRGADVCIDAVGMEAHRSPLQKLSNMVHAQVGTIDVFRDCVSAVRRGGIVSVVGVYGVNYDNFPLGQVFDKGLRLAFGQVPVHRYIDDLLAMIRSGKLRADDVITHRLPLSQAAHAYKIFNDKKDDCVKCVLHPD